MTDQERCIKIISKIAGWVHYYILDANLNTEKISFDVRTFVNKKNQWIVGISWILENKKLAWREQVYSQNELLALENITEHIGFNLVKSIHSMFVSINN